MIYPKRVIFPKNLQQKFLYEQAQKLGISLNGLADLLSVHRRTFNDWKREEGSMPIDILAKICKITSSKFPQNIDIREPFWYVNLGAKNGGIACLKKYGRIGGDQAYQKKKWYEWWHKKGQYNKTGRIRGPLPIKIPKFSKKLAEFSGIVIGDGGITDKQVIITTNSIVDKEYAFFIKNLIKELFDLEASIIYRKKELAMYIMVSRKKLVKFCNKKLGLHIGNKLKQGLDIPTWIRNNSELEKACIRGIMDTDGCIFEECHKIKGKFYNYKRLNITSASPFLRKSIFEIFEKNELSPKVRNNRCVQIEDKEKIKRYFEIIGTHNPKHLKRYYK